MTRLCRLAFLPVLLLLCCSMVQAQKYTSIVVFGDSLSDTGNDAHQFQAKYGLRFPGPSFDYTDGRFTDGIDTFPSAQKYDGVWVEQLARMFPAMPAVTDSLDGGRNYAYGFATTGGGTAVFALPAPYEAYTFNIDNIGKQITDYLATHPKIDDKTLFVVWGGAIDVLYATSSKQVLEAGIAQAENVERLVEAGATQFVVPNLPPLGAVPRLNQTGATAVAATEATVLYNRTLAQALTIVNIANGGRHLKVYPLDVFALFTEILAKPAAYGFVNVTSPSQGVYPLNPDTYLFWDDLHPTTHGHNILATTTEGMLQDHECLLDPFPLFFGDGGDAGCRYLPKPGGWEEGK